MDRVSVRELIDKIDIRPIKVLGDLERIVTHPVPLNAEGGDDGISFCKLRSAEGLDRISRSRSGTIVCHDIESVEKLANSEKTLIVVENPRLYFIRVIQAYFVAPRPKGIDPSAIIHPSALVDPSSYIGPMAYVGPNTTIGRESVIHGRVYIYGNTKIGNHVIVHAGTVIGADGFGFERNEAGGFDKFPHSGGVEIGDNVEIGANTCIDRGTLSNTVIGSGTKVDNLVHVAHNVRIEEDCAVIAHAMIAGSVTIGRGSWVAPSSAIRESVKIGSDSLIGLGAVVVNDVKTGTTVMGAPARESHQYKAMLKAIKDLVGQE